MLEALLLSGPELSREKGKREREWAEAYSVKGLLTHIYHSLLTKA